MQPQGRPCPVQQSPVSADPECEAQASEPIVIPKSWSLNEAQRHLIDSMIETREPGKR